MSNILKYSFNGNEIAFAKGKKAVMVNATEMAKPFGKVCKDWLRTEQAQRMVTAISGRQKCHPSDLVRVINGDNGGTWMHEDVALVFAQWLSPEFYLWCNDRIKELLTTGVATVATDDETILNAITILQNRIEESKARQRNTLLVTLGVRKSNPHQTSKIFTFGECGCACKRQVHKTIQPLATHFGKLRIQELCKGTQCERLRSAAKQGACVPCVNP